MNQTINKLGLHLIQHHEKLRLEAYLDQGKKPTIGWGHLIQPDVDPDEWLAPGFRLTPEEAEALLRKDLSAAEAVVNNDVTVPINENEFSALVSFAYNVGGFAFRTSGALAALNRGDRQQFLLRHAGWVNVDGKKSDGLVVRRALENFLFTLPVLRPDYEVTAGTLDEKVVEDLARMPANTHILVLRPKE